MNMTRRTALKALGLGGALTAAFAAGGCMAPRVDPSAWTAASGAPWRCTTCGHLARSTADLSNVRCPRCHQRHQRRITEEQMQQYLKDEEGTVSK